MQRLPFEQLAALGDTVLDFRSRQDLEAWLDANR